MLNRIKDFLLDRDARPGAEEGHTGDELHLAAAALMVEAARMDDGLDEPERHRIAELVRWRFDLTEEEAATLVEAAEREAADASGNYRFTATIRQRCSDAQRVQLVELLWDIVYADGKLHDLEASLLRRISGLLYVSDRDSGLARKRVLQSHGLSDDEA